MIKSVFEIDAHRDGFAAASAAARSTQKKGTKDKLSRRKERQPLHDTLTRHVAAYEKEFEAELAKQRAAMRAN